ncbi:MAG: hypothetical protein AAF004_10085 [Pseudomonadota bacterium]
MNKFYTPTCVLTMLIAGTSLADDTANDTSTTDTGNVSRGKFQVYGGVMTARTPILVDSIEVISTGTLLVDDVDVDLGDQLDITSRNFHVGMTYRPVPILEVSLSTVLMSTTSDAETTVSGSFSEPLPILGETFSVTSTNERDSSGVSYQGGVGILLPIVRSDDGPWLMRAGITFGFNDLDNIETQTVASSLTLVHSKELFSRRMNFAVGVTHLEIDRVVEFSASIGGGQITLRQEQSLEEPWSVSASIIVPFEDDLSVSFTTANNFEGMNTVGIRLGYHF